MSSPETARARRRIDPPAAGGPERDQVKAAVKSAAWTICLLAEVLKESEVDWIAASHLARILEGQAEDLKALAWTLLLSSESDLEPQ